MLEWWNAASLGIFDFLLGWLLLLPSDIVLFALALITAGLMAIVRPLVTNQDLLRRAAQDSARLKELIRDAKRSGNREALQRYRATSSQMAMRKLGAEIKPLAIVLLPVALLATWAMFRVEFHPPAENESVEMAVFARSPSAEGEIVFIVPHKDLKANGWVKQFGIQDNEPTWWDNLLVRLRLTEPHSPEPDTVANWVLKGKAQAEPYSLLIRYKDQTVRRELLIGQATYSPALTDESQEPFLTQLKMREVKLFGIVPGFGSYLQAWLVGYLLIVIPLVFVVKWGLRIY